jgi:protein SCO1/2
LGNWTLIYFGFTNCPDICPEELDKMGEAVKMVDGSRKERVLPVFISVDPARDGVKEVKKYILGEQTPGVRLTCIQTDTDRLSSSNDRFDG